MGSAPLETSSGCAPCGVVIRKRVPTASSDVQSSQYVHSVYYTAESQNVPANEFIFHPAAGPTVHENRLL